MIIPDNHISVSSGNAIREICDPLFSKTDINFFIYCRFYDDGTLFSFPSNTEWHQHFMKKEYFSNKLRLKEGHHLWAAQKAYSLAAIDARENFNIDNKFEIVERGLDYYDIYGFASRKGANSVIDYYINNIDYLKKFWLYFKNKAEKLIYEAKKNENRIIIKHQMIQSDTSYAIENESDFMSNRIKHYYINIKNKSDLYLTRREMQVVLYTLQQRSASNISKILNISSKTVESYLASAKDKIDCTSRADLFDKMLESGLIQLIGSKEKR